MIEEEQTTQASETADNQSLLAVTKEEEVAAEIEVPHRELTAQELEAQKAEEPEKPDEPLVRPDYWPENFWSEEEGPDVEALAKSYQELRTKFSQGKHKPPKDGNYDASLFKNLNVPDDDPMLSRYISTAKELGISQDAFDKLASIYIEEAGQAFENVTVSRDEEIKKLGNRANDIIQANNQWLTKLSRSVLNESETNAIAKASTSAAFVSALNKIRQASGEMSIPTTDVTPDTGVSKDDLYAMVGDPKYGKDMVFTRKVEKMFQNAFGDQQYSP